MNWPNAWARGRLPPVKMPKVALGDTQLLLLLSILIGVASGLLVVCFHIAIDTVRWATIGLPGVGESHRDGRLARARRRRRDPAGPLRVPGREGQRRDSHEGRRPHL